MPPNWNKLTSEDVERYLNDDEVCDAIKAAGATDEEIDYMLAELREVYSSVLLLLVLLLMTLLDKWQVEGSISHRKGN